MPTDILRRQLYIVHASDDRALAGFLKAEFETSISGLRVFVASKAGDIPTGSDWLAEIHQNLRSARLYLLLLTPRSIKRPWVRYEACAAWFSERRRLPVAAAGLDRGAIPFPLAATQVLLLDEIEDASVLFRDLGGRLASPEAFCSRVRHLGAITPSSALDEERIRNVQQAFGELGEPPRFVLRRMLVLGGLTLPDMAAELAERLVSDSSSVERLLKALKDRRLVQGDFEGRWRIKPELEAILRRCFEPPSLSTRMRQLSAEMLGWVEGQDGLIDSDAFQQRFGTKLSLLRDKAARDHAEGHQLLRASPSSAGGVRNIAVALAEVPNRLP